MCPSAPSPLAKQVIEDTGLSFKLLADTIASHRTLSDAERPVSKADVIQTWVKQQSKVVGRNLAPYFKSWGWPITAATESTLAGLPAYSISPSPPPSPPPPFPSPRPPAPPLAASTMTLADYQALTAGVGSVATESFYASRHFVSGHAMAIVVAGNDKAAVVSATTHGLGRVVHTGHEAMLTVCCGSSGLPRLALNAARWAAGNRTTVRVGQVAADGMEQVVSSLVDQVGTASRRPMSSLLCPLGAGAWHTEQALPADTASWLSAQTQTRCPMRASCRTRRCSRALASWAMPSCPPQPWMSSF